MVPNKVVKAADPPKRKHVRESFEPWGMLTPDLLGVNEKVPFDFRTCASETEDRLASWQTWRGLTLERIKKSIWPQYLPDSREWEGDSVDRMIPLTEADLALMAEFQSHRLISALRRPVDSALRGIGCPGQSELFKLEDTEGFGEAFLQYDRTVAAISSKEAVDEMRNHALLHKVSSVSSQFKFFLQRPRPYQVALRNNLKKFEYRHANTADTPSICSGHSIQGLLSVGGIMERFIEDNILETLPNPNKSLDALQQWAVDTGDRRVLAGVHYPSDNLCSWLIFLCLADRVFNSPDIKARLWNAVKKQSVVYREIARVAGSDPTHPYTIALNELNMAAAEKACP